MTYYHNKIDGNVYSSHELSGHKTTLLLFNVIEPITDAFGINYCILINPSNKRYKVVKKETKSDKYKSRIKEYKKNGYIVVKNFGEKEVIKKWERSI